MLYKRRKGRTVGDLRLNAYAARMKQGDEEAFAFIYERTKKGVFSSIYAITRDYEVSEELMQDTYIKLKQNITRYKEGNFSAWLLRIAGNLALNHVKKSKREVYTESGTPEIGEYRMNEEGTPVLNAVKKALGKEEAEIVILHAVSGYKHREIAKLLNKPLGTITWTYNNAIRKLQRYLAEEEKL